MRYHVLITFDPNKVAGVAMPVAAFGRFKVIGVTQTYSVELPIYANVVDEFAARPSAIFVELGSANKPVNVTITSASHQVLEVCEVTCVDKADVNWSIVTKISAEPVIRLTCGFPNDGAIHKTSLDVKVRVQSTGLEKIIRIPILSY